MFVSILTQGNTCDNCS